MTLYLARKWCVHGAHEAPADTFRPLPGVSPRRDVCQRCYDTIMQARQRLKTASHPDIENTVKTKRLM
jgi:hypothetical protein